MNSNNPYRQNQFEEPAFWLTNISNRNVSIADLNLTVKAFSSVNLLDKRHYQYTFEQLQKSAGSGSIYKKSRMLVVRKIAPEVLKDNIPIARETFLTSRERSTLAIKEEHYEELEVSDEEFAKENADTAEMDTQPLVSKRG